MADFHTSYQEENLIHQIRKNGLDYQESELHKYYILRIAIALALRLKVIPLNDLLWEENRLPSNQPGGKEYRLEQIIGDKSEIDLLRAIFYIQHKEELDQAHCDLFKDEKKFLSILGKYIHRGLFEISNTWKPKDCFYQWCLDHLKPIDQNNDHHPSLTPTTNQEEKSARIKEFYKDFAIPIEINPPMDSFRHQIYRIRVKDTTKLQYFESKSKDLDKFIGVTSATYRSCKDQGISNSYDVFISKPQDDWQNPNLQDFLKELKTMSNKTLGVFAGYTMDKTPICFDILDSRHLIVAGTTGSGKTAFLKNLMLSLILEAKHCEVIFIDPKNGASSVSFRDCEKIKIITNTEEAIDVLTQSIQEMEERYQTLSEGKDLISSGFLYRVIVIDELNDLLMQDKQVDELLARLAQKAREANIFLVLGTQRPSAEVLSGNLRSNIPSRIALQVQKTTESKIILDEIGAEKLLGKGEMLIKLNGWSSTQYALSAHIIDEEIQSLLQKQSMSF